MLFCPLIEASQEVQESIRLIRNQEDVRKYMYTDHEISAQEHESWLKSLHGNFRQSVFVALYDKKAAGVASLTAINTTQKTADWAFYLDTQLQGKGLGSMVEFWMLEYAFGEAGLEKLNCEVLATNPSVVKMHQKFGFSIEGVRRENILKEGRRIDVILLGITKKEWLSHRSSVEPLITRLKRKS